VKHFGAAPLAPNRSFFWHKMSSTELVLVHVGAKFGWRHRCSLRRQTAWRRYSSQRTAPDPLAPTCVPSVQLSVGAENWANRSTNAPYVSAPSMLAPTVLSSVPLLFGAKRVVYGRKCPVPNRSRDKSAPRLYGANVVHIGANEEGADMEIRPRRRVGWRRHV
jgi:hypothetical protein